MNGTRRNLTGSDLLQAWRNAQRDPLELMRELMTSHLKLSAQKPLPWLAIILVDHTMPAPGTSDGSTIDCATVFPRVPAHIRRELPKIVRKGMTIDVGYAQRRGEKLALYIMCDGLMVDDMETAGRRIKPPDDPISRAIADISRVSEVEMRCWKLNGGSLIWHELQRETQEFEDAGGLPRGTITSLRQQAERMTDEEWLAGEEHYRERLRQYGTQVGAKDV